MIGSGSIDHILSDDEIARIVHEALAQTPLAGKAYDILILFVGKIEDMDISALGQVGFDSSQISLVVFLAVTKAGIDRKLAHFKTFVEQEFAKLGRFAGVLLGIDRQVEHYEYPHQPVSTQVHDSRAID